MSNENINPFYDVPILGFPVTDPNANGQLNVPVLNSDGKASGSTVNFDPATITSLRNLKEIQIGNGANVFRADRSGIWLGASEFADAPFSVDMAGNIKVAGILTSANYSPVPPYAGYNLDPTTGIATFLDVKIMGLRAGSNLDGTYISDGTILAAKVNKAIQGWNQTCVFSSTDLDTVSWASGVITFSDGISYNISAGNTGNMAARTYIYLDVNVSTTAYQITTTAATAVGNGKVLIATAINGAASATFESFGGDGGSFISGNTIAANSIVANQLSISTLSAITADMGAITAGTIVLNTSGYIRGGQTDYNTGTGFFLGYSGAYKFSIGNPSGDYLTWDGTNLAIKSGLFAPKNGVATRNMATASGTQTIAHGLTIIPKYVRITGMWDCTGFGSGLSVAESFGVWNVVSTTTLYKEGNSAMGSDTTNTIFLSFNARYQQYATVAVDATNITLTWTKADSPTGTAYLMWEVW